MHTVSAELDISPKLAKNGFIPDTTGKSAYIPETLKSGRKMNYKHFKFKQNEKGK